MDYDYIDVDQMFEDRVCCAYEEADYYLALRYGRDEDFDDELEFDDEGEEV